MIKNFFLDPFILSLVVGFFVFVFFYIRISGILDFFKNKTMNSQKEVLHIADMMLIKMSHEKIILRLWIFGLSFGFIIFLVFWPHLIVGVIGGLFGFLFFWMGVQHVMRGMWEKRSNKLTGQMVDGLGMMMNGVKVGLSVAQAMQRVITNLGTGPLVQEFQLVLNKTHLGMSIEEALNEMEKRIDRPDVTMMVVAVNILKETGGNIAETLEIISETIRARQKVESKIKSLTAQGMMQATIISAIPFVMLVMMFFLNREAAQLMVGTTLGLISLAIIIILIIIGSVMMKKIVTIKV